MIEPEKFTELWRDERGSVCRINTSMQPQQGVAYPRRDCAIGVLMIDKSLGFDVNEMSAAM